jgi:hypothetical protein
LLISSAPQKALNGRTLLRVKQLHHSPGLSFSQSHVDGWHNSAKEKLLQSNFISGNFTLYSSRWSGYGAIALLVFVSNLQSWLGPYRLRIPHVAELDWFYFIRLSFVVSVHE